MEEVVSFHVAELTKARHDYDSLYEKFKVSNSLIEEKDKLHQQKLLSIELSNKKKIEKYLKKIYEQNVIIKSYVDIKEKFENDVKVLEEASILLEEREQTYINKINELKDDVFIKENNNVTLSNTINSLKHNLDKLLNDNDHYQHVLKNEMVPKTNYEILTNNMTKLNNDITNYQKLIENEMIPKANFNILQNTVAKFTADIENYQNIIKNEMVPKTNYDILHNTVSTLSADVENYQNIINNEMVPYSEYERLQSDIDLYRRTIAEDMVSKSNYENLHCKYEELLKIYESDTQELITTVETGKEELLQAKTLCNKLQKLLNNMVPTEEYEKVKHLLQQALEDKRVAEESANVISKMRDSYVSDVNEAEARIASLKGRVERSERELRDSAAREEKMKATIDQIEVELEALNDEYTKMKERCLGLENSKASLLTQLGNLKLNGRRESEHITQLKQTIQELEKQNKEDQLKFKEKFREANSSFILLSKELEAKIHDRESQVDNYRVLMKENDTKNEKIIDDLKLKIKHIKSEASNRVEELQKQSDFKEEEIAKKDEHINILGNAVKDLERSKCLLEDDSEIQKKFIEDLLRKYSFQGKTMAEQRQQNVDQKQQLDASEKIIADLKTQILLYQSQLEEIRLTALEELGETEDESTVHYNATHNNVPAQKAVKFSPNIPKKEDNNFTDATATPNSISQLTTNTNISLIQNESTQYDSQVKMPININIDLPTPTNLNIDNDDSNNNEKQESNETVSRDEKDDDCKYQPQRADEFISHDIGESKSDTTNDAPNTAATKTPKKSSSTKSKKSSSSSSSSSSNSAKSTYSQLSKSEKVELKAIEKRLNEFKKLIR